MWNPNQPQEEDDNSWEIRAFEKDTGNLMGITWPPRSYTCTLCRREFRSAQALGGHMNVHRRDRAQFRHRSLPNSALNCISSSTIPAHEFGGGGSLCFLNAGFISPTTSSHVCLRSPSATLSISPFPSNNSTASASQWIESLAEHRRTSSSSSHGSQISSKGDESIISTDHEGNEKLDLELRLGYRPSSS